ncbi:MAG: sugar phosphate isomerase/epimerase [Lunatimonas sp.]|uniref:sugar phosphate isomerase/epimerase family protein n=1 Tax=Lunatimonas sp. TaxID=2060141 RepID=UPI00263AD48D|nr:sugar phosphate isomerase/epimerase [Lunatimonas sp.]MCC5938091.1 sugar phosphate isomerase/epimerase [Lunatimonas sp.]
MKTIKGPALFLAQFADDKAPFNNLKNITTWAASIGYKAVQIPTWDARLIDLQRAAEDMDYVNEIKAVVKEAGLEISDFSTHLQGQLVAVHPAYNEMFDAFAPKELAGDLKGKSEWATQQLRWAAKASHNFGLKTHATFSGALMWHTVYPWPQRPTGLVDTGFEELAKRWLPILDEFDKYGVDVCYELHPGEDLHDGVTFEKFLEKVNNHKRANILYDPSHFVLQCLNYLDFIDIYHDRIKMFHVKDAEFNPTGRQGVYGGYSGWVERAGRFRSLGDGQVDFNGIFSKLSQYDFDGWAVLEWECALKHPENGAIEGAKFISEKIIRVTEKTFDDFASTGADENFNRKILGIS